MKKDKNKFPVIETTYDANDYDNAIERALRKHGYQHGEVIVICKPKTQKRKTGRKNKRR